MKKKKVIWGFILFSTVVIILFLTFQDSAGTLRLSETVRGWLRNTIDLHSFRSYAHLVVYFVFGILLTIFGHVMGWKWWKVLLGGCVFALFEEGIKVWLPTREFELGDLFKDWIGFTAAFLIVTVVDKYLHRK